MNAKISVVTVCYNACEIVEKTILSVISQTYNQIEYIVIDGNSKDGTQDIIKRYQDKINYYISEPDRGIYDAMNKGIAAASGEYILFMNAGDTFYNENVLSDWTESIDNQNADVYYGDVLYNYPYGERYMKAMPLKDIRWTMVFSHQSVMVASNILKKRLFNLSYKYAADYDCLLRCYMENKSFLYTPIPISIVEMDKGATASNFCASKKEVLDIHRSCGYSFIERYRFFITMMIKYYIHTTIKHFVPTMLISKIQDKKQ